MITIGQRIEELRTQRGMSRPALSGALGLPKTAVEKFETGRQTPTQEQQEKLAAFFGVSLLYLRGETSDGTRMEDWMAGAFLDQPEPVQAPQEPKRKQKPSAALEQGGTMFEAFLGSKKFQESMAAAVLEVLRSPEGQEILAKAIRRELGGKK